jgi:hypothetical protein
MEALENLGLQRSREPRTYPSCVPPSTGISDRTASKRKRSAWPPLWGSVKPLGNCGAPRADKERTQFWMQRYWTWRPPLRKPILSSSFCLRMPSLSAPVPLPKCLALVSCVIMVSSPSAAGNNHLFSSESCPRNTANVKVRRMLRTIYGPLKIRDPTRCLHRAYIVHDLDRAFYFVVLPQTFPPITVPSPPLVSNASDDSDALLKGRTSTPTFCFSHCYCTLPLASNLIS